MTIRLWSADCKALMSHVDWKDRFDSIVTDPPYGINFMGKEWDNERILNQSLSRNQKRVSEFRVSEGRTTAGFGVSDYAGAYDFSLRGKAGFQEWCLSWATQAIRVLKPGGHALVFGGTRTHHRLMCGLEDAGFEIRDVLMWVFGSGFPKSMDIGKQMDKMSGLATDAIKQWEGWGTALKPAWEIIILARKPFTNSKVQDIIAESLTGLEAQLWSLLPVKIAEQNFGLSPHVFGEVCGFAQWTADERSNTLADLLGQMDMSQLTPVVSTCLNTVLSWSNTLAGVLIGQNTSTIETGTSPIIDLGTLKSCLLVLTLPIIIQAEMETPGSQLSALPAAQYLNAVVKSIIATQELSVLGSAIGNRLARCQVETGQGFDPAWEPIILCRKPISEKTVAGNVLRWGAGGLNIDDSRVQGEGAEVGRTRHRGGVSDKYAQDSWTQANMENTGTGSPQPSGRFPANLIHDGSEEVVGLFPAQAARFFYAAKASRSERWTYLHCNCQTVKLEAWIKQDRNQRDRTDGLSPNQDTFGKLSMADSSSNTSTTGNKLTDSSQRGTPSTTSMGINKTTGSQISKSSPPLPTNASMGDVSLGMENGGNPVASAKNLNLLRQSIGTSLQRGGPSMPVVVPATLAELLRKGVCEECNTEIQHTSHPTVKPLSLMQYLCRLITPPGGLILDPFMGSGTTLLAASEEGFDSEGIERDQANFLIAMRRLESIL